MCQMSIGHMLVASGVPPPELWHDAATFAEVLLALRERYGFDGILVSLHGHEPGWERRVAGRESGPGGERVRWKGGGATVFPADELPLVVPDEPPARPEFAGFDRARCRTGSATSPFPRVFGSSSIPGTPSTRSRWSSRRPAGSSRSTGR
jgi:hypothetical protein